MSAATGLWGAADAYERYMGRWSRRIADLFLDWIGPDPGARWLDVGCGTGELTSRIAARCAPAGLTGIDSTRSFLDRAEVQVPTAQFRQADAVSLPVDDATIDYVVSGLVLNFVPDKAQAVRELARVARPGGTVALYVWDYAGQMQIMRRFFDAARALDPAAVAFDDGVNAPICRPAPLREAFAAAGLTEVETQPLDIAAAFVDFDDYWQPFLGGTGSAPRYCASLDDTGRERLRDAVRARLPVGPDGEILLAVRAWAVKARKPPQS